MRKAEKENNMKKIRRVAALLVLLAIPLMLTGCLPGDGSYTFDAPAGFLAGIWHGWLAPISLILELCGTGIHMFENINTGFAYELGFYMAVISGFGGLALVRRRKHRD